MEDFQKYSLMLKAKKTESYNVFMGSDIRRAYSTYDLLAEDIISAVFKQLLKLHPGMHFHQLATMKEQLVHVDGFGLDNTPFNGGRQ